MGRFTSYRKATLFAGLVFTVFGVLLSVFMAQMIISDMNFKNSSVSTTAIIYDIDLNHTVFIKYTVSDIEYTTKLNYWSSKMRIGDQVKISYNPTHPNDVMGNSAVGMTAIGGVLALAFAGLGITQLFNFTRMILSDRLLKTGTSVMAEVTSCGLSNTWVRVDIFGRRERGKTYIVKCMWLDESGVNHFFKSEKLTYDPQDCFDKNLVEVFVDPNNYKKYKVNL